jgi:hypothetical protein
MEKQTGGSQFFGTFPSDCTPKAKKDVNLYYFFIHNNNFCELYQRIPGNVLKLLRFRVLESFIFTNPDGILEQKELSPAW